MKEYKISLNDEEIIELKKMFQTDNIDEAAGMALRRKGQKVAFSTNIQLFQQSAFHA